jgi:hypothetical protein
VSSSPGYGAKHWRDAGLVIYVALVVGLFLWSAWVFYNVENDALAAFVVLVGAVVVTGLVVGFTVTVPSGEPITTLINWVVEDFGWLGLVALIVGWIVGKSMVEEKQRGS